MSASKCGDDNCSHNTAISLQQADLKEGEGNVCPSSLAQQIFSDPEAVNLLRQVFNSSSHDDGCPRSPQGSKLHREVKLCRSVQGSLGKPK